MTWALPESWGHPWLGTMAPHSAAPQLLLPPIQTPYFWTSTKWPATELDYGRCHRAAGTATGCSPFLASLRCHRSSCSHLPGQEEHSQAG